MPTPPASDAGKLHKHGSSHMHPGKIPDLTTAHDFGDRWDSIANNATKWNGFQDGELRNTNSDLTEICYVNSMFAQASEGSKFPAAWYMKNSSGSKLVSKGYGNYLMNPKGAASYTDAHGTYANWKQYVVKQCQLAQLTGIDGCFMDMQGPAPLSAYLKPVTGAGSAAPFNPTTGKDFTTAEYLTLAYSVADAIRAAGIFIVSNGLVNGLNYQQVGKSGVGTKGMLAHTDVGYAEIWLRTPGTASQGFPTEARWLQEVGMLIDANLAGYQIAVCTKYWRTAAQDGLTTPQWNAVVQQWRRYCLCSVLIGQRNGLTLVEFSDLESNQCWTEDDAYYGLDLGAPLAAPTTPAKRNGVYNLRYTNGIAMVNPTTADASLTASPDGRAYKNADTLAPITYPHRLARNHGEILLVA